MLDLNTCDAVTSVRQTVHMATKKKKKRAVEMLMCMLRCIMTSRPVSEWDQIYTFCVLEAMDLYS